ncbi:MAG: hypothetical protein HZA50_05495 [Planctomycetes bacterium]|nr:hypothetical protein [Planctomycetota bacterium]
MATENLAGDFWPQLQQIADAMGYFRVTAVTMKIGSSHGLKAGEVEKQFSRLFAGSMFGGAKIIVQIVQPGQEFIAPNSDQLMTASGWELLVMKIDGEN